MSDESIGSRLKLNKRSNNTINKWIYNELNETKRTKINNKNNKFDKNYESINNGLKSRLTFDDLNDDVLRLILSYLPLIDKMRSESVSKRFQLLINDLLRNQKAIGMKNMSLKRNDCTLDVKHCVNEDFIDRAFFTFNECNERNNYYNYYCDSQNAIQRNDIQCVQNLKTVFNKCPKILSIDLRCIQLSHSLVNLIADYCPKLECLNLNSMLIEDSVWYAISDRFSQQLRHLTIRNSIKSNQEIIVQNLIKCCVNLKALKVTEWTPQIKWFENISDSIDEIHIACTSAVSVFKNLNNKKTNQIKTLKLSTFDALPQSVINSIGANFVNLTKINIRNCEGFSKRNFQPIASLVQLQELRMDLPFANCDDDFAIVCQKCTKMRSIEFNFGSLTLNSLQIMAKYWPLLECVSFRLVSIEKLNSDALLVLKSLKYLRKLNLRGTNINDDICQVIQSSQSLRYLNLDLCNFISKTVVQQFIISSKDKPKELFELSLKETRIRKLENLRNSLIISDGIVRLNNLFIYYTPEL